jgi:transposase-like protein
MLDEEDDEEEETEVRRCPEGKDRRGGAAEQSTIADLAQRYQVHPNQVFAWRKQLIEQASRAFYPSASLGAEERTQRTIEDLYAKIRQLTVERDSLSKRSQPGLGGDPIA